MNKPIEPERSGRALLAALLLVLTFQLAQAAVRFTESGDSSGTLILSLTQAPTAGRALCATSGGIVGTCAISLATGLCISCAVP